MNYQIITDEKELDKFIEWLPDLKPNEQFYWSLFARKKYCKSLIKSNDKTQLGRGTASKENLKDKIRQLEIPVGNWKLKKISAPQESLVFYLTPNPRCMLKATAMMAKHCVDLIVSRNEGFNLQQEALSCIQKSKSYTYVVKFDIDNKNIDLGKLKDIIPVIDDKPAFSIIETRGGYCLLIKPLEAKKSIEKANESVQKYDKNWYSAIKRTFEVDDVLSQMVPVPGTTQGMFTPKFIEI